MPAVAPIEHSATSSGAETSPNRRGATFMPAVKVMVARANTIDSSDRDAPNDCSSGLRNTLKA